MKAAAEDVKRVKGLGFLQDKNTEDCFNGRVLTRNGKVTAEELEAITEAAKKYGNGVTSLPYNEQIFVINENDESTTNQYIPRETLMRVVTPQAYKYNKLDDSYHKAFDEEIGIYGSSYTNTMMAELGEKLYFAAGSDKNIKLTTTDNLEMFKAYLKQDKQVWLK